MNGTGTGQIAMDIATDDKLPVRKLEVCWWPEMLPLPEEGTVKFLPALLS